MQPAASGVDRRSAQRTEVTLPTEIRYEGLDCTGFVADISRTGAFLRPGDEADPLLGVLSVGDLVELHLAPVGGKALVIPARVVHRRPQGIGVEFSKAAESFGQRTKWSAKSP